MPAGYVRTCRLWRFSYPQDDVVGGSVPSGTVLYERLDIRVKSERPTLVLLEQGLEIPEMFSAFIFPGNIDIEANDQIEFTAPVLGDWFYEKKFRVIGLQRPSTHPSNDRNQVRITMKRWDYSRTNDLQ